MVHNKYGLREMSVKTAERVRDVKIFGPGELGGKGAGLVKINECNIPKAHKLRTRILTTAFYDSFLNLGGQFGRDELDTISSILKELGHIRPHTLEDIERISNIPRDLNLIFNL